VGRCGDVGDDIGSRIITARLAHDVMRLCFLVERRYVPYPKWFGTAFARLSCAREISPLIADALRLTIGEAEKRPSPRPVGASLSCMYDEAIPARSGQESRPSPS
jgi:hypothetical protein